MICTKRAKNIYLLILIIVQSVSSCSVTSISTDRKNKEITISSLQAKGYNITNHLQPRQFEGHNDEELQRVCIEGNDTIPSWCFSMIPTLTGFLLITSIFSEASTQTRGRCPASLRAGRQRWSSPPGCPSAPRAPRPSPR